VNVHGHIHQNEPYGPQYRNVSVERINYTPVPLESL
jgi:calcineurin-like phosphoesterase family protein